MNGLVELAFFEPTDGISIQALKFVKPYLAIGYSIIGGR